MTEPVEALALELAEAWRKTPLIQHPTIGCGFLAIARYVLARYVEKASLPDVRCHSCAAIDKPLRMWCHDCHEDYEATIDRLTGPARPRDTHAEHVRADVWPERVDDPHAPLELARRIQRLDDMFASMERIQTGQHRGLELRFAALESRLAEPDPRVTELAWAAAAAAHTEQMLRPIAARLAALESRVRVLETPPGPP